MRLLVIDDSAFMRRMISQVIASERGMEVVGAARNGRERVEMAQKPLPDLITLDIEMPELDGLGALRHIRHRCRDQAPGILMFSSLTTKGSTEALEALRLGAAAVIAKDPATIGQNGKPFRDELISKLRVIGGSGPGHGAGDRRGRASSGPGRGDVGRFLHRRDDRAAGRVLADRAKHADADLRGPTHAGGTRQGSVRAVGPALRLPGRSGDRENTRGAAWDLHRRGRAAHGYRASASRAGAGGGFDLQERRGAVRGGRAATAVRPDRNASWVNVHGQSRAAGDLGGRRWPVQK